MLLYLLQIPWLVAQSWRGWGKVCVQVGLTRPTRMVVTGVRPSGWWVRHRGAAPSPSSTVTLEEDCEGYSRGANLWVRHRNGGFRPQVGDRLQCWDRYKEGDHYYVLHRPLDDTWWSAVVDQSGEASSSVY